MNRQPYSKPPRWWPAKINPLMIRVTRWLRGRKQRREQRVTRIDVQGAEHLKQALADDHGVLVIPNHPSHADSYVLYEAADRIRRPFFFMTAWQVFEQSSMFERRMLQWHGCFSVDREGRDKQAIATSMSILLQSRFPLVIFPEGDVYHQNDWVTPFRDGAAAIALLAARRATRPIVCVPCALKYFYTDDPTPDLSRLMDVLEQRISWRPRSEWPLTKRIYRFAKGALALKELEFLGRSRSGSVNERLAYLIESILSRMEARYTVQRKAHHIPERVKNLRQHIIGAMDVTPPPHHRSQLDRDMDDLFLVVQLYSYPGEYVADRPNIERVAETLDKLEEDVLGIETATIRGQRRAIAAFGEPIPVPANGRERGSVEALTKLLEQRVQGLLDGINQENGKVAT